MTNTTATAPCAAARFPRAETQPGEAPCPAERIEFAPFPRWQLLDMVAEGRRALGLTANDIAVLRALLSFLPVKEQAPVTPRVQTVVFASNAEIAKRAAGLDERVLRRAFERLSRAGLLLRRDSANGKRFPLRRGGRIIAAFGLDLAPAFASVPLLADLVSEQRAEAEALRSLRAMLQARRRALMEGLQHLPATIHDWLTHLTRIFRRKLAMEDLQSIASRFDEIEKQLPADKQLPEENSVLPAPIRTAEMPAGDGQNVRHKESLKKDIDSRKTRICIDECTELRSLLPHPPQTLNEAKEALKTCAAFLGLRTQIVANALTRLGWQRTFEALDHMARNGLQIRTPNEYFARLVAERTASTGACFEPLLDGPRAIAP